MNEYYRGFTGFEIEHILDFEKCMIYYKRIGLAEYEKAHLDEDILFPPGDIRIGIRDERNNGSMKTNILMDLAVFTMKLGGENLKRILEKILLGISIEGAAKEGAVVDITKMKDELERLRVKSREDKEKIDILEKEKKIAEERIKSAENDVIKLQEIEKTSEITTSHPVRRKVRQKATISAENPKKKKSSTQEIKKGKITEIPIKSQDELISENGTYKKRFGINRFKIPQQNTKDEFVDAPTDQISTIPRTLEEHEELDKLNINFKGRLEDLEKTPNLPSIKGKKKAVEISDDDDDKEEKTNKNKKRVVRKQGERENSDKE
ncbi:unnamed protein product [Rhizophagus irregularis]|nr:unnamed protein product [Rhizophagus irregularis]